MLSSIILINLPGAFMKRFLPVLLLSVAVGFAARADVKFQTGTFKDVLAKAGAEKKPIMIDFYTDWCRWCDTLDAKTYSDAKVGAFIDKNVVPYKIDAEKGEGIEVAKKYGVRAYPTVLLIKSDGEEIDRLLGYMPPDKFLQTLDDYLKGVNTLGALKAEVAKNPNDTSAQYQIAAKYSMQGDLASASPYYKKMLELDPKGEHADEASFYIAMHVFRTGKDPTLLNSFADNYPNSPYAGSAVMSAAGSYLKEKKYDEAQKLYETYFAKHPDAAIEMNNIAWNLAGQKVLLDYAAKLSAKAVSLAKTDDEKAMYLDTQATVEFNRGNVTQAIAIEEQALGLLKNAPEKTRKDYETTLAKFKAGTAAAGK
jgi:thioredoxin-related protein